MTSLLVLPRTTCGAQILTVLAVFVVVLVMLGQPLTVAAGVAGWLVAVAVRASTSRSEI